jgi:hypothetical protein
MAKASDENGSDGQGRKLREQTGLDTRNFLRKISGVSLVNFAYQSTVYGMKPELMRIYSLTTRVVLAVNSAS